MQRSRMARFVFDRHSLSSRDERDECGEIEGVGGERARRQFSTDLSDQEVGAERVRDTVGAAQFEKQAGALHNRR